MLYKYYRFNEHALSALQTQQLYCSHYESFNDPFECWCSVKSGFPDPNRDESRFLEVIGAWGFSPDRRDEALASYSLLMETIGDSEISVQNALDSATICCFCRDPDNLLMWSHYADGLRGFCVQFDRKALSECSLGKGLVLDVAYRDTPPEMDTCLWSVAADQMDYQDILLHQTPPDSFADEELRKNCFSLLEDLYINMLATKPRVWEYEKEARLIIHSNEPDPQSHLVGYHPTAIKSVIIGSKMDPEHRARLVKAITNLCVNIPIRVAQKRVDSYRLSIELVEGT